MSYIPGQEEIQDQRKNEYLQVCRRIQNRMPLGFEDPVGTHIFVRVSWQVIQEATGVGRDWHDNERHRWKSVGKRSNSLGTHMIKECRSTLTWKKRSRSWNKKKAKEEGSAND